MGTFSVEILCPVHVAVGDQDGLALLSPLCRDLPFALSSAAGIGLVLEASKVGRHVRHTHMCMCTPWHKLFRRVVALGLPLEPEEASRGCNGVQQESVSRQQEGGTRGIRARPGEGKGRSQKGSKNTLVSITVFASFSLESTSVSASWELQVSWFSFSPVS